MLILKPLFAGRASEGPVRASDRAGKATEETGEPLTELGGPQRGLLITHARTLACTRVPLCLFFFRSLLVPLSSLLLNFFQRFIISPIPPPSVSSFLVHFLFLLSHLSTWISSTVRLQYRLGGSLKQYSGDNYQRIVDSLRPVVADFIFVHYLS